MTKGLSIHVGVNRLDQNYYHGRFPKLNVCDKDAKSMCELASDKGFERIDSSIRVLIDEDATASRLLNALQHAGRGPDSRRPPANDLFRSRLSNR